MKNSLLWHEICLFGVSIFLVFWKLILYRAAFGLPLLYWMLGMVIGFLFVFLDRVIYSLITHTEDPLSKRFKEMLIEKKYVLAIETVLNEKQEQRELVMRSFLFVAVWFVLGFLTMTSSINYFARGLILGIGTHLVFDLITDYVWNKDRFNLWFWQIKRKVGDDEKKWFVGLTALLYLLLANSL